MTYNVILIWVSQYILLIKVDSLHTLSCLFRCICWGQTSDFFFFFWTICLPWAVEVCSWYTVMWLTLKKFGWERCTEIPDCFIVKLANCFWIVFINLYHNGIGGFFLSSLRKVVLVGWKPSVIGEKDFIWQQHCLD